MQEPVRAVGHTGDGDSSSRPHLTTAAVAALRSGLDWQRVRAVRALAAGSASDRVVRDVLCCIRASRPLRLPDCVLSLQQLVAIRCALNGEACYDEPDARSMAGVG